MDGLQKLTNAPSNGTIPDSPTTAPSPNFGVRNPHSKFQSKISGKRVLTEE